MTQFNASFDDPAAIRDYAQRNIRLVPGLLDLQKMTGLLVAECAPAQANVLVVGAGGGVELKSMAESHPLWQFVGVDPSKPLLVLAQAALGSLAARVRLHHGYTDTAATGPYDAATCLLTFKVNVRAARL